MISAETLKLRCLEQPECSLADYREATAAAQYNECRFWWFWFLVVASVPFSLLFDPIILNPVDDSAPIHILRIEAISRTLVLTRPV